MEAPEQPSSSLSLAKPSAKPGFLAPAKVRATWLLAGFALGVVALMIFNTKQRKASP